MNDHKTNRTNEDTGEDRAREAAASKTTGMASAGMSSGWSVMWDPAALGELRTRRPESSEDGGEKEATGPR